MRRRIKFFLVMQLLLFPSFVLATEGRFFLEGDGSLSLTNHKTGRKGTFHYRDEQGHYPSGERLRLQRLLAIPAQTDDEIALRLIALLDHLEDHFAVEEIRIFSSFRTAQKNQRLRRRGRPAARASLHLEGMAVDMIIPNIPPRKVWNYLRSLQCCGAGLYPGGSLHLDTGPSRFWEEATAGVEEAVVSRNKFLILRTDQDLYRPGETVRLRIARITDFPVEVVPVATVVRGEKKEEKIPLQEGATACLKINSRREARALSWKIPEDWKTPKKILIRLDFCKQISPEMPEKIDSNQIEIQKKE